jgi:hypothetical protein
MQPRGFEPMLIRLIVSLLVAVVSPAFGQEEIPQSFLEELARDLAELQQPVQVARQLSVRAITDDSKVYAGASTATRQIGRLAIGDEAPVLDNTGGWYAIQLPNESSGWVQARNVAPVAKTFSATTGQLRLSEEQAAELFRSGQLSVGDDPFSQNETGWVERKILSLLERASNFRDAYQNNPYVIVRGFDLNVSVPPSLGISFEFKE